MKQLPSPDPIPASVPNLIICSDISERTGRINPVIDA
jgi:hypothetical protein